MAERLKERPPFRFSPFFFFCCLARGPGSKKKTTTRHVVKTVVRQAFQPDREPDKSGWKA